MGIYNMRTARLAVSAGLVTVLAGSAALAPSVALAVDVPLQQGGVQEHSANEKRVATVDGVAFNTLAEAISAAKHGGTVEVESDLTAAEVTSDASNPHILITEQGTNVTIDLNKHTITLDSLDTVSIQASDVTLKICDGTIANANPRGYGLYVYHNKAANAGYDNVNVTFEGVKLTTKDQAIGVQGNNSNNNVTLRNCVINAVDSLGAYWPPKSGTLTLDGTTINAGTGIISKGGKISIVGDTVINATGAKVVPDEYYDGNPNKNLVLTGDAVYMQSGYNDRAIEIDISSGEFKSANNLAVRYFTKPNETAPDRKYNITGGSYSSELSVEYLGAGFAMLVGDDGVAQVMAQGDAAKKAGASVEKDGSTVYYKSAEAAQKANPDADVIVYCVEAGGERYASISEAIKSSDSMTVTLISDLQEDVVIAEGKTVALDLAGHKITSKSSHTITNNGTLSIADSSAGKTGVVDCVTKGKAALFNGPTGIVKEISSGTFERSTETDSAGIYGSYYLIENQGKIEEISGGNFHSGDGAVEHLGAIGSLIRNGGEEPVKAEIGVISGGEYLNAANVIKNEPGSKIGAISGGTFTMDNTVNHWQGGNNVIQNNGEIGELTGGQFKALGSGVYNVEGMATGYWRTGLYNGGKIGEISGSFSMVMEGDNNRGIALTGASATVIKGGTFTVKDTVSEPARASILFNVNTSAAFDVMGGTFSSTPEEYVADGYVVSSSNGMYTVSAYVPPTPPSGGGSTSDKTEVEHNQDGSTTTTVTKPDGSQTITHETATGTESVVTKDEDGNVTSTEVTVSKQDAESGRVELPIAGAEPAADAEKAPAVEVKVPAAVTAEKPVQVTVPVAKGEGDEPNYGIVVFAVDAEGNETVIPKCSVDKDGNVVFEASGDVTIKVVDAVKDMPDVKDSDWFAGDVVDFATARGIVNGVDMPDGSKQFQGYGGTSRGMLVAMLHNLEMNPGASGNATLPDVPANAFYAGAAAWALEEGILSGVDMPDGTKQFQGEAAVTREQMAVFLMRYAERLGMDVTARADIDFPDAGEVSGFAKEAMSWAVAEGLFTGDDVTGELNPTDGAARAEVAAVLMRFINLMYA